ncbi:MAG: hypothetical protein IPF99_24710 [Deltaproteobacteria bacterium]|nr:hypothetical protein [Deltaproteobacteria bacterium]
MLISTSGSRPGCWSFARRSPSTLRATIRSVRRAPGAGSSLTVTLARPRCESEARQTSPTPQLESLASRR